jgi:hypothetical protein
MASVMWLNLERAHTDAPLPFSQLQTCALPLRPHANLETLNYDLAGIENEIMAFSHNVVRAQQHIPGSGGEDFLEVRQAIHARLDLWYHSFSTIRPNVNDVMESRHFLLRANYLFLTLRLDTIDTHNRTSKAPTQKENTHESRNMKLSQFSEILDLAEMALKTTYPSSRYDAFTGEKALEHSGLLPLFSFRTSFISPVFFVAQNAPDINLRWRAIRLLSERPWREGAWDSAAMGAIAERSLRAQTPVDSYSIVHSQPQQQRKLH